MALLRALLGLMVAMCLVTGEDETLIPTTGMPPFMFLSPPSFKAGHTTNLKLMFFTEYTGNITVRYYNFTQQYYPERLYFEDVLMEETFHITEESKIVDIPVKVPDIIRGQHKIKYSGHIEGFGRFQFESGTVSVRQTGYKSYVQTDKPVYKPGQPVRFRGFSIDSDLKGLTLPEGMKATILNPDNVKVYEETIFNENSVIHGGTFLLAEEAKVGIYTIRATGRSVVSCTFSVEEYVLPKFGVEIEGPKHIGAADTIIRGKVTATYTYGKPVNGRVVLRFAVDNKQQSMYSGAYHFQELTAELVEGEADWEIDITDLTTRKLKYLFNPFCTPSNLVIAASVTDDQGAFNIEKTDSSTQFTQSSLKLSFNKNTQKNYAAGFPYYVELDVEALTGTGVNGMSVKLTMISGLSDLKYVTRRVTVSDGKVFALFQVPEDACAVKITAEMDIEAACDEVFACFQPERMVSKGDEFVRFVKSEPRSYSAGESASYRIEARKAFETLHFVILSKGSIVKSWNQAPEWNPVDDTGKYSTEGKVTIPSDMITRSRLIVMSANPLSGHILADAIDLCIVEELKHSMDLQIDAEIANPGQNVTLYLSSDPASFVGISVNDASLNLLREPCKVLTKDSTLSFLRDMDGGTTKDLSCVRDDPYQCTSSTEVKIIDVKDLLRVEGLNIETNMNLFDYVPPQKESSYNRYNPWDMDMEYAPSYGSMSAERMYKVDNMEAMDNSAAAPEDEVMAEGEEDAPRMRNFFPEAWLWTDVIADRNGRNVLSVIAPDTITAWRGSAFGLSPENGLGFSNEIEFKTFLPFFVSLDLPYSGIVGERISVPVRVYNYLETDVVVDVQISSELWDEESTTITVESNKATTVDYEISLTEAGSHDITVTAQARTGESDSVRKSLLVQPGGEKIVDTSSVLIMEKKRSSDRSVISVELPTNFIPGSHRLKVIAVGDILGEAVTGISSLIQLPSGCGEQNMHKVAVNVFSANYLRSLYDELPQNLDYNIKHNLNVGLQQQLAYRRGSSSYSNGYSVFKGGDSSYWLSAFVNKVVAMFPEDVFVPCDSGLSQDKEYLMRMINYAGSSQYTTSVSRNGWAPFQYNYHSNKDLYWYSYFLISLLESEGRSRCGADIKSSAYSFGRVGKVCNATLELAAESEDCCYHHMVAYSLQLCRENGLLSHVKDWRRTPVGDDRKCMGSSIDRKYKFVSCQENLEFESVTASSKSIEATSYAALYFMKKGDFEDTLPIIMWLASQRNENGGFRSSQDTVMGLQALAKFAELISATMSKSTDLNIVIGKGKSYFEKIRIRENNKMTTKEVVLSPEVGNYKFKWTGTGTAFVQLVSSYHVTGQESLSRYGLKADAMMMKGLPAIMVSFLLPRESASTMFLLEIRAPTGMVFSKSLVEGQLFMTDGGKGLIIRYDIKESGQRLHLYVDPTTKEKDIELTIPMDIKFEVSNRMPAQVSLIDYYEPSFRDTVFYSFDDEQADEDKEDQEELGCSLTLSCDMFTDSGMILVGYPGEQTDETLLIDQPFAYKACSGQTTSMGASQKVKFDTELLSECTHSLQNTRSVFLVREIGDGSLILTGMTDYQSFVPFAQTCDSGCPQ